MFQLVGDDRVDHWRPIAASPSVLNRFTIGKREHVGSGMRDQRDGEFHCPCGKPG